MKIAELKDRLKEAMEMQNIKQVELAEAGPFDKGQLSSWLSGKYKPRQRNIDRLSEILGVNEAWLMGYDVPQERPRLSSSASISDDVHPIQMSVSDREQSHILIYRDLTDENKDKADLYMNSLQIIQQGNNMVDTLAAHSENGGRLSETQRSAVESFKNMVDKGGV